MWRYPYFVIGFIVLTVLTLGLLRTVYAEDPVAALIPYAIFIVADIVLTLVLTRGRKHKLLDDRVEASGLTGRTTVEYSDIQEAIVTHTALSFRIAAPSRTTRSSSSGKMEARCPRFSGNRMGSMRNSEDAQGLSPTLVVASNNIINRAPPSLR